MGKSTLIAVAAGLLSLFATFQYSRGGAAGLFLSPIAGLPIYLVGFSLGAFAATVATLTGFIAATVLGGTTLAVSFALFPCLPAWAVVRQALQKRTAPDGTSSWYPPGHILASLTGVAATIVVFAGISSTFEGPGLQAVITEHMTKLLEIYAPHTEQAANDQFVSLAVAILPAAIGCVWIMLIILNAILAQGILSKAGKNLRPSPEYSKMTLPDWISWAMVLSAVVALMSSGESGYIARNLTMIMALPFFLLGLAVIYDCSRHAKHPVITRNAMYILIIFTGGLGLMISAAIGVLEQWAGLRSRLGRPANDDTNDDVE